MACNVPAGATGARTRSPDSIAAMRRRSCLSVPGSSERMLAKAPGLGADEVVLDLEDSIALEAKDSARSLVAGALRDRPPAAVRINGLDSAWWRDDVDVLGSLAGS